MSIRTSSRDQKSRCFGFFLSCCLTTTWFRGKILRLLDALHRHKHGASFFEFNSGNLLNKNGEYRLTDLSYLDTFRRHSTCVAGEDEDKGKDLAWIDTPFDTTESKIFSMCCYAMRVEAMKLRYWKRGQLSRWLFLNSQ